MWDFTLEKPGFIDRCWIAYWAQSHGGFDEKPLIAWTRDFLYSFEMDFGRTMTNLISMMISPFRYPGGKTWLIPYVRSWLGTRPDRPREFVEPFAGGAAVGLAVANEGLAAHVTLVEIDNAVASVWRVIINGEDDVDVLAVKIKNFQVTEQSVEAELSKSPQTLTDLAFQTIVRNRSSRGGFSPLGLDC